MKRPRFYRWLPLRFSLRTLFVAVTLVAIIVGQQVNWIRQRHNFLEVGQAEGMAEPIVWNKNNKPMSVTAPGFLWIWGEAGLGTLMITVWDDEDDAIIDNKIRIAQDLFPEAEILAWRFGADGSRWLIERILP